MSNRLQDRTEIQQWIVRKLGGALVRIEVTPSMLDDCVNDALQWFVAKKGIIATKQITLDVNTTEYPLGEEIDEVLEVIFSSNPLDFTTLFSPFAFIDQIPYDAYAGSGRGGMYSSFTQALAYIETAKNIISAVPEWQVIHRTLMVYNVRSAMEDGGGSIAVIFYKPSFADVEDLKARDHDLVRRYALAEAKISLSHVRGKYATFPTAQGQVGLNADALFRQGQAEKEDLDKQISDSAMPMGMIIG